MTKTQSYTVLHDPLLHARGDMKRSQRVLDYFVLLLPQLALHQWASHRHFMGLIILNIQHEDMDPGPQSLKMALHQN